MTEHAKSIVQLTNLVAADISLISQFVLEDMGDETEQAVDRLIDIDAHANELLSELDALVRYALVLEDVYGDLRGAYPLASDVLDRYEQGEQS